MREADGRAGFTLAELAVAVMIVGILAGLALPSVRGAMLRADAAAIVSDSHTISVAAYEYLTEIGRFPASGAPGSVPAELASYLPDDFQFNHKGSVYSWLSVNFPSADNPWRTRNLGILIINSMNQADVGAALQSFDGPDAIWTPFIFFFLYRG